jgi:pyrimidine deaminase RibD-like protein
MMEYAIELAAGCKPKDPRLIPKVSAVIDVGGKVFIGQRGEDEHAEKNALARVAEAGLQRLLPEATVYTTLEPCTKHVRRKPRESCTERLIDGKVRRVVIGILDPNQGVCGKGVLELQAHNVEVSLFPHELAERIRALNADFVRAQQSLGITFVSPTPEEELPTYKTSGRWTIKCTCINPPGNDVFVLMQREGLWWPQRGRLRQIGETEVWEATVTFGATGRHALHIVKASDLGAALVGYYQKITEMNEQQRKRLREFGLSDDDLRKLLNGDYPGIVMPTPLPKGLDTEAVVEVNVVPEPKAR